DARQPNLYPPFPGFVGGVGFDSELAFDQRHQRAIPARAIRYVRSTTKRDDRVQRIASMFVDEIKSMSERALPDVVICAPSIELMQLVGGEGENGARRG